VAPPPFRQFRSFNHFFSKYFFLSSLCLFIFLRIRKESYHFNVNFLSTAKGRDLYFSNQAPFIKPKREPIPIPSKIDSKMGCPTFKKSAVTHEIITIMKPTNKSIPAEKLQ